MILILAKQIIKPECFEKYHALTSELAEKSRLEDGCESYRSVRSKEDAREHIFVEYWKDQAAIDLHGKTEHFTRIVPQLAEMFDGEEVVEMYEVVV